MTKCHIEPKLECIQLEGVCVARGLETVGCSDLRHYIMNRKQEQVFLLEMARDYERVTCQETKDFNSQANSSRSTDTYHRPDDDFGGRDGRNI